MDHHGDRVGNHRLAETPAKGHLSADSASPHPRVVLCRAGTVSPFPDRLLALCLSR